MRRSHLEAFRPRCPVCATRGEAHGVEVAAAGREAGGHLVDGILRCTADACRSEFPIVDGVPLLLAGLREFVGEHLLELVAGDGLSAAVESLLGDCAGSGSRFDAVRRTLSAYGWDHWGDLDPAETAGDPSPGAIVRLLERGLELAGTPPGTPTAGPVVELGSAMGRAAFELAATCDAPVLGLDADVAMLRAAAAALRTGVVRYPRRRLGLVYDRRRFEVPAPGAERLDFWLADAAAAPLAPGRAAMVVALNVLDSVASPSALVRSIGRLLAPGGVALLASPYDWSPAATPPEAWIGGHSQRGEHGGAAEPVLRWLLAGGGGPEEDDAGEAPRGLEIVGEDEVEWQTRHHDRSVTRYRSHLVVARRPDGAGEA